MGQNDTKMGTSTLEEKKDQAPEKLVKQVDRFIYDPTTDMIGYGAFAMVYRGIDLDNDDRPVAIKLITAKKVEEYKDYIQQLFLREISVLMELKTRYFVNLLKVFRSPSGNIYIVTTYCNEGSLEALLKKRTRLTEAEALTIVRQIAEGMQGLSELELRNENGEKLTILHRDIKPANLLLHDGEIRIADFGFSKLIEDSQKGKKLTHTQLGTPSYMSPEILTGSEYSFKCDVWATGIVLYQMLFGRRPWEGSMSHNIYENILDKPLEFPRPIKHEIRELIKAMLTQDEQERIDWNGVLEHPAIVGKGPDVKILQEVEKKESKIIEPIKDAQEGKDTIQPQRLDDSVKKDTGADPPVKVKRKIKFID